MNDQHMTSLLCTRNKAHRHDTSPPPPTSQSSQILSVTLTIWHEHDMRKFVCTLRTRLMYVSMASASTMVPPFFVGFEAFVFGGVYIYRIQPCTTIRKLPNNPFRKTSNVARRTMEDWKKRQDDYIHLTSLVWREPRPDGRQMGNTPLKSMSLILSYIVLVWEFCQRCEPANSSSRVTLSDIVRQTIDGMTKTE